MRNENGLTFLPDRLAGQGTAGGRIAFHLAELVKHFMFFRLPPKTEGF